ncbi:cyclic nucleotide-binding domain-containing protein [Ruegeria arenilitoris]|uniref:cyclic nucleotide-binding domain-containing protein n=1 Tax=Ruegeria arenilitoris TaxID=1173585 RepID=UPI00147B6DAF|nr:cyclic nucleotide-binding domain-containing protein [Ruegeria arenilitoris]
MVGLDLLVNAANVFYLISYSVRDIFWLRVLSVIGAMILLPYYYLQPAPMWAPIGWNLFFTGINIFWIVRLLLERRPVPFTDMQRHLYEIALRNFSERDAYDLLSMGVAKTVPVGTNLLTLGNPVHSLSLIVDGEIGVEMSGDRVDTLGEGRFLGGTAFLAKDQGFTAPVTVTALKPSRVIEWNMSDLTAELQKQPDLAISIEASLGLEISRFLQTARLQMA